jgi:transposase
MVESTPKREDFTMTQVHKRFTAEQVKILFQGYCQGNLSRPDIEEMLAIGKTRFFALLKSYRQDPEAFSIDYQRSTHGRLSEEAEDQIKHELLRDKALIDDPELPIHDYNYAALVDRLKKQGIQVSTTTVIKRAKALECYKPKKKGKAHDQEVLTASIGDLIQHDASLHKWSPYAEEKWTLITSIDDYSRMLLYADFVPEENTWTHIQAAQSVLQTYGLPFRYYVDNLRVFRFVQKRDSFWRTHHVETDGVDPQWKQVLQEFKVKVIYALSPQAKGRWSALIAGCKTELSELALWRGSNRWKKPELYCGKKFNATTLTRCTQPREKCQSFDLQMPKRPETACFGRLCYRNPTNRPRMSSA